MTELQQIWELRNLGRIADCRSRLVAWGAKHLEQGVSDAEAIDYGLLEVSLLRNALNFSGAREAIQRLESRFPQPPETSRYAFAFQRGLNAFAEGNFLAALDRFIEARIYATDPLQRAWVGFNQLLSLDELGWEQAELLESFRQDLAELAEPWRSFFEKKASALELRKGFRTGQLSAADSLPLDDYAQYLLQWLKALPYLTLAPAAAKQMTLDRSWLCPYRVRTLSGLLLESDLRADLPLREKIERFYLWTWNWLADPRADSLDRILELRRALVPVAGSSLSPEHGQMLENALRWLGLFAFLPESELKKSIAGFSRVHGPGSVLLDYEKYLLDFYFNRRARSARVAADTLVFLTQHPAHSLPGFHLPSLAGLPAPALAALGASLAEIFPEHSPRLENGVVVHAIEKKIRLIVKGRCESEIPHAGLVTLCLLLKEKLSFTKAELLRYAFGLPHYDSYSHDSKIANLLSTANGKLRGILRFQVKGDVVTAKVLSPERLRYEGECRHTRLLACTFQDPGQLLGAGAEPVPLEAPPVDWISRSHFEKSLNISKATATRRMRDWLAEGILEAKGRGKSSRYRPTPQLAQRLLQEGVRL